MHCRSVAGAVAAAFCVIGCGRSAADASGSGGAGGDGGDAARDGGAAGSAETSSSLLCGNARPLCATDDCRDGVCAVVEIVTLPQRVEAQDVDESHVYFIGEDSRAVMRVPVCGGTVEVLARNGPQIDAVEVFGDHAYWRSIVMLPGVFRTPKSGGTTISLMQEDDPLVGKPRALHVDADGVYVAIEQAGAGVVRVPHDGGPAESVASESTVGPLVGDSGALYFWSPAGGVSNLHRLDKETRSLDVLFQSETSLHGIAVSGEWLFAGVGGSGWSRVLRIPREGGAAVTLVEYDEWMFSLYADTRCAYTNLNVTSPDFVSTPTEFRVPIDGGAPELLAGQMSLGAIGADAIFLTRYPHSIFRMPK